MHHAVSAIKDIYFNLKYLSLKDVCINFLFLRLYMLFTKYIIISFVTTEIVDNRRNRCSTLYHLIFFSRPKKVVENDENLSKDLPKSRNEV